MSFVFFSNFEFNYKLVLDLCQFDFKKKSTIVLWIKSGSSLEFQQINYICDYKSVHKYIS